jgi:thiosulfate/3-mercaptopyruvate sulfurtransferase
MTVLIDVSELQTALGGPTPPTVLDARYPGPAAPGNGLAAFLAGHVPGSQWVDLDAELANPARGQGGRHPLPDTARLEAAMRRVGVDQDRPVVVLDADNSLAAGRLWWLLRHAGHEDVRVLDGGFAAWQRAGGQVQTGHPVAVRPGDFAARTGVLPTADAQTVAELLDDPDITIWDVRAAERYRGEVEPIDPVPGHIPGARNLPAADNHLIDGRFRPAGELRQLFTEVRQGDVVYCGSGITAAQALVAMEVAGVGAGVRLYPGSWSDWISTGRRPIARG